MKRLKKGFTLIELLVVIAIIGILATTLAPKLREQLAKAKDSKAIAVLGATRTGAEVILIDKLVQDTTGGDVTISLGELVLKLDTKASDLIDITNGQIAVGGTRAGEAATLNYGETVVLAGSETIGTSQFVTSATAITVTDNVDLFLQPSVAADTHSTEGKEWTAY